MIVVAEAVAMKQWYGFCFCSFLANVKQCHAHNLDSLGDKKKNENYRDNFSWVEIRLDFSEKISDNISTSSVRCEWYRGLESLLHTHTCNFEADDNFHCVCLFFRFQRQQRKWKKKKKQSLNWWYFLLFVVLLLFFSGGNFSVRCTLHALAMATVAICFFLFTSSFTSSSSCWHTCEIYLHW